MFINTIYLWTVAMIRDISYVVTILIDCITCKTTYAEPIIINADSKSNPIILIHGSSGSQIEWAYSTEHIKKYLSDHPTYAASLDLHFDEDECKQYLRPDDLLPANIGYIKLKWYNAKLDYDTDYYSIKLDNIVNYLYKKYNKNIILIGHSFGGIIGNYYSINGKNKECIDSVISISSPLRGAPLLENSIIKYILNTKRHKQMTPNSKFLNDLHHSIQTTNHKIPRMTVGSNQDISVPDSHSHFPDNISTVVPNYNKLTFNGHSHNSILHADTLWKNIAKWL